MIDEIRSHSTGRRILLTLALLVVCVTVGIGPAAATGTADGAGRPTTFRVQGTQVIVDPDTGLSRMLADPNSGRPGLVGDWFPTRWDERYWSPTLYIATGTEQFDGCVEVNHRDGCQRDEPTGRLTFDFVYWARWDRQGRLLEGRCVHPITGGSGDFAGAAGTVIMIDTTTADGALTTTYSGTVTIARQPGSAAGQRTSADSEADSEADNEADSEAGSVAGSAAPVDRPVVGC